MTSADYVMLLSDSVLGAVGLWRGFTTEAMSLATLLAALVLAWLFGGVVEPLLGDWSIRRSRFGSGPRASSSLSRCS